MELSYAAQLCLQLSDLKGFGLKLFHQFVLRYGDIEGWVEIDEEALLSHGLKRDFIDQIKSKLTPPCSSDIAITNWLGESSSPSSRRVISFFDDVYPDYLREIPLPPVLLYLEGEESLLQKRSIAIVGSRKPSLSNQGLAEEFAFHLAANGYVVTSGMALGVDTAVHMGALAAKGDTIAVLGTGIDRCYPCQNQTLYERIAAEGLLISEMPLGSPPLRQNFPRRNRIVSGLSGAVLVVEAGIKSGSLITARYAIEQNRDVFAIPGSPTNAASEGCHYLIREGASLVASVEDLFKDLSIDACSGKAPQAQKLALEPSERIIYQALGSEVLSFDDLLSVSNLSLSTLSGVLLDMELKQLITVVAGGYQKSS